MLTMSLVFILRSTLKVARSFIKAGLTDPRTKGRMSQLYFCYLNCSVKMVAN